MRDGTALSRRAFARAAIALPWSLGRLSPAERQLRITGLEVFVVNVSARGDWIFVRLGTNRGLTGLGEASHGFGYSGRPRAEDAARMKAALAEFFELVRDRSPFDIEAYRQRGWARAKSGALHLATAFSAIEQAQWDLAGQALDAPVCDLLGGKLRDTVPVYANINRATTDRSPAGFAANTRRAVEEGFRAVKAAPFDNFVGLKAAPEQIRKSAGESIACIEAMRRAAGPGVNLMVDCHSKFDVKLAVETARRLEPQRLYWYEEPVPPERVEETVAIRSQIQQRMAGGELLFAMEGFKPLCVRHAVHVVMPDVKHCGGIQEGRNIAALAALEGVEVSPHNPSGPVATAASVQWCAGLANFSVLEYAWNEAPWRADLLDPPERFERGEIRVPRSAGFGIRLNEKTVRAHA